MDIASIIHQLSGHPSPEAEARATGASRTDFASLLQILGGVLPPRREVAEAKAGQHHELPADSSSHNQDLDGDGGNNASLPPPTASNAIEEPRVPDVALLSLLALEQPERNDRSGSLMSGSGSSPRSEETADSASAHLPPKTFAVPQCAAVETNGHRILASGMTNPTVEPDTGPNQEPDSPARPVRPAALTRAPEAVEEDTGSRDWRATA